MCVLRTLRRSGDRPNLLWAHLNMRTGSLLISAQVGTPTMLHWVRKCTQFVWQCTVLYTVTIWHSKGQNVLCSCLYIQCTCMYNVHMHVHVFIFGHLIRWWYFTCFCFIPKCIKLSVPIICQRMHCLILHKTFLWISSCVLLTYNVWAMITLAKLA